jgi:hypothetical protein
LGEEVVDLPQYKQNLLSSGMELPQDRQYIEFSLLDYFASYKRIYLNQVILGTNSSFNTSIQNHCFDNSN